MYEKLLVAVDHSKVTEHVLSAARDLASLSHGEVWVLHLREREVMPRAGLIETETSDEARAQVEAAVEEFTKAGIKTHAWYGTRSTATPPARSSRTPRTLTSA
jgi:nucleotide-binding universal stress UspA family protein